ncbi:MAG: glycosyltransferase family 39 protein [Acidobacteriaceae bacterium]|nr:glycosyltransferase family 39 protein [Acidobacteriaceae bacterium]
MLARLRNFFHPQDERTLPRRIFWVAFVVRVLYMTLAHTYRLRLDDNHMQFGWEAGRIARALLTGYGYSDPFANVYMAHTGPTAWLPPLYPLLMAAVFKIFGIYTLKSAWVLFAINSALSAATAVATWEIACRCFNRRVALWSGWLWALYPAAMQYAVRWPWEMTLTCALFAWTLVLALRMRNIQGEAPSANNTNHEPRTSQWLLFGLLWGLIAMSNSTLLIFLPVCGLWILLSNLSAPSMRSHRMGGVARIVLGPALAALIFLASIAPWTLRNWQTFHAFIPMRGNFGAEMYLGNGPDSQGLLMEYDHPYQAPDQLRLYASMGEVRYVAMRGAMAKAYIDAHPAHFYADVAKRIDFFWISVPHPADDAWHVEAGRVLNFAFVSLAGLMGLALALRRRVPAAGLFAWAFFLLPIPYYMVTVHARFRHPLEPLICILSVYLFQSATPRKPRIHLD